MKDIECERLFFVDWLKNPTMTFGNDVLGALTIASMICLPVIYGSEIFTLIGMVFVVCCCGWLVCELFVATMKAIVNVMKLASQCSGQTTTTSPVN